MNRINQGQHLLKMIEGVDVNDTDTLDEIDARFWCFLNNIDYDNVEEKNFRYSIAFIGRCLNEDKFIPEYTHNLQALHDVMPEGS